MNAARSVPEPAVFLWLINLDDPALDALAPCLST